MDTSWGGLVMEVYVQNNMGDIYKKNQEMKGNQHDNDYCHYQQQTIFIFYVFYHPRHISMNENYRTHFIRIFLVFLGCLPLSVYHVCGYKRPELSLGIICGCGWVCNTILENNDLKKNFTFADN